MGKVRPFVKDDIPQVEDLHSRAFADSTKPPSAYFEEVFFRNPWFDEAIPSLVYEQNDGKIIGFLGVMPRPLSFKRQTIQAAIASQFMVDPSSRTTMAGLQLLKTFFAGPQDLSMTDLANDAGRKVWEVFKSQTVWSYSMRWQRTLRPTASRYMQSLLRKWKPLTPVARASGPLYSMLDSVAERTRGKRLRPVVPQASEVEINEQMMVAHGPEFFGSQSLQPEYDECSLQWLLERAAGKKRYGTLQKVGVRNGAGDLIGWYIYYLNPQGSGRVLQIAAKQNASHEVLDSLFYHAWRRGGTALRGWLEPRLITTLAAKPHLSYDLSKYWMLVHARDRELQFEIHRGNAFLTQLEGEWVMGFHGERFE